MELLALLPLSQLSLCSTGQPWAAGGQLPAPGDPMQSCSITRKENLLCSPLGNRRGLPCGAKAGTCLAKCSLCGWQGRPVGCFLAGMALVAPCNPQYLPQTGQASIPLPGLHCPAVQPRTRPSKKLLPWKEKRTSLSDEPGGHSAVGQRRGRCGGCRSRGHVPPGSAAGQPTHS